MPNRNFFKTWFIRLCRYVLCINYLPVMAGPLKGYYWSTGASYDYILGRYEAPDTLQFFLSHLTGNTIFYDIGANIGFYTFLANTKIKSGKIYAFEPVPAITQTFQKHISLNTKRLKHNTIHLNKIALGKQDGQVQFSNDMAHRDGNTYITESYVFSGTDKKLTVTCRSIDSLVDEGFAPPDLIKIDVEGAEYDVLLGAVKTLKNYTPALLLATHDCHLPGVQLKCIRFLEELGYQLQHTGSHNKHMPGLDDYIAVHKNKN